ncbi:double-stranded RNA-binding-like domain-containing protein [Tanacetum coccineum]
MMGGVQLARAEVDVSKIEKIALVDVGSEEIQVYLNFWKSLSFVIIVTRGYWGNRNGKVHNFPTKVIVRCRSVTARLVPTLHGTKAVAARVPKKVLLFAGLVDIAYVYHGAMMDKRLHVAVGRRFVRKRSLHDSPRSIYSEGASTSFNANGNVSNEHVGPSNAATQNGYFTCYRRCEFGSIAEAAKGIAAWFPGTLRERFFLEEQLDSTLVPSWTSTAGFEVALKEADLV